MSKWRAGARATKACGTRTSRGRPLSAQAIARRAREPARTTAELAAQMGVAGRDLEWDAEAD
jgi:hypothetical protein